MPRAAQHAHGNWQPRAVVRHERSSRSIRATPMTWSRAVRALLGLLLVGGLTACPQKGGIWLAGQAGAGIPVFTVGQTSASVGDRPISAVLVSRCPRGSEIVRTFVWVARQAATDTVTRRPRVVIYGQAPTGFETETPAQVLGPGCYTAAVGGAVSATFSVDSLGDARFAELVPARRRTSTW